jgi:hypothetical protein
MGDAPKPENGQRLYGELAETTHTAATFSTQASSEFPTSQATYGSPQVSTLRMWRIEASIADWENIQRW